MFKSLMDSLTDLAQSRLLGIISNKKRLVASLLGSVSRHRAYSAADPTHPHAVAQQKAAAHTHMPHNIRAHEYDAIDSDLPQSRKGRLGVPGVLYGHWVIGVRLSLGMSIFWVRLGWGVLARAAPLVAGGGAIIVRTEVSWRRLRCCD